MPVQEVAMTAEERRTLIMRPILFTVSGGKSHGGAYHTTDEQEERSRERYLSMLRRRERGFREDE